MTNDNLPDDDMSFFEESENVSDDDDAEASMGNNSTRTLKEVRDDVMVRRSLLSLALTHFL